LRFAQLEEVLEDSERYTSNTAVLLTGDFNMDVSRGSAAGAITRALFQDAFAKHHESTTPGSLLEHGRIIDWVLTRGRVRSIEPLVHGSVSASDHYPLSINVVFV
jgi:endonuclease/exonuclease/phosphatase family metal-dependent hydrolase